MNKSINSGVLVTVLAVEIWTDLALDDVLDNDRPVCKSDILVRGAEAPAEQITDRL